MTPNEELERLTEQVAVSDELAAAKDAYRAKPSDDNKARLADAKAAARTHAEHWRSIAEAERAEPYPDNGVAAPATVKARAGKVK